MMVNADGVMEEWLSTGNMLTMTDADGNVSREFHQVDMKMKNGKLSTGYVSSMENVLRLDLQSSLCEGKPSGTRLSRCLAPLWSPACGGRKE